MKPSSTEPAVSASFTASSLAAFAVAALPALVPAPRVPVDATVDAPVDASVDAPVEVVPVPVTAEAAPATVVDAEPQPRVRAVTFDRPLAGPGASRGVTPGWGDPQIDALIAQAAEAARTQALAEGYAAGWAQGRRAAADRERLESAERERAARAEQERTAARAHDLLLALVAATRTATTDGEQEWSRLADALTDGALAIAGATLARELSAVDEPVAEAVRTAVRSLGGTEGPLVVRVHPKDVTLLAALPASPVPDGVQLVADPSVRPGTVVATTPVQRLLVDLAGAVAAAREVLQG